MSQDEIELTGVIYNKEDLHASAACKDAFILIRMFDAAAKADHEEGMQKTLLLNGSRATSWKVGDECLAVYADDGEHYPARIVTMFSNEGSCEVEYIGYEDSNAVVELRHLLPRTEAETEKQAPSEQTMDHEEAATTAAEGSTSGVAYNNAFPIAEIGPPPPLSLLAKVAEAASDKEALSNMLMSWYMSGYHTGYYRVCERASAKQPDP